MTANLGVVIQNVLKTENVWWILKFMMKLCVIWSLKYRRKCYQEICKLSPKHIPLNTKQRIVMHEIILTQWFYILSPVST